MRSLLNPNRCRKATDCLALSKLIIVLAQRCGILRSVIRTISSNKFFFSQDFRTSSMVPDRSDFEGYLCASYQNAGLAPFDCPHSAPVPSESYLTPNNSSGSTPASPNRKALTPCCVSPIRLATSDCLVFGWKYKNCFSLPLRLSSAGLSSCIQGTTLHTTSRLGIYHFDL